MMPYYGTTMETCSCGKPLQPISLNAEAEATDGIEYYGAHTLWFYAANAGDARRIADGDTPDHDVISTSGKRYLGDHGEV